MKKTKFVAQLMLIFALATSLSACGSSSSPVTKNASYAQAKQQWGGELLLPTNLSSEMKFESVSYNDDSHSFEATTDSFVLIEIKTNDKSITKLSHGQLSGETIDNTVARVQKQSKPVLGHANEITQIEKVKIGDTVGYWYEIQNDDGLSQLVEFVQDGIQVYLRTTQDKSVSRDELVKIAASFAMTEQ
ncbi:DUF4367 domain-containing protein [Tumebacillus permanentifrigoris]|uniref:Uncharacterized protein DUF4367 n=1 Tax=Tumebacillus permanentifrigoris TaxID=378543 RepID=A0A316D9M9_9BACL|nr:DUF4367 domain-containing protein [Tumebacillus permanentifrigoris]PWK13048.1 uncharacterized protein DUF4367 [Tumebacillus permanentifrigoris]